MREVFPSSRPSGWFCVRRGLGTLNRSQCAERPPHRREQAHIPHPYRVADARSSSSRPISAARRFSHYPAQWRADRRLRLHADDRHPPEVGYWLGVKHWGKGYATAAVRAVIDHTFTDLDCDAIHSSARVTNPASRRVLEKCGSSGPAQACCYPRDLKLGADRRFRLDRGLWASLKSWGAAKRIVA